MPAHHCDLQITANRRPFCFDLILQKLVHFVFVLFLFIHFQAKHPEAFNLDAEFSSFVASPRNNIYFGYSVDYYKGSETWITVGAPKSGTGGNVFKCSYSPSDPISNCSMVKITPITPETLVRSMLGTTIEVGPNKELLSCDPMYAHRTQVKSDVFYDLIGICYFLKDFTKKQPVAYRYLPCITDIGVEHYGPAHSSCQAGFSSSFTQDKSKILLGAVGSYYNQGSLMLLSDLYQNKTSLPIHTAEITPVVPPNWGKVDYYRQSYDTNLLGYSVATGVTGSKLPLLVTSAPRRLGFDLRGMVVVYDETMERSLANFTGEQIGEYFGYGLAVVDVNGDGLDDVIAGSPLYTDTNRKKPEIGRIYVYYQLTGAGSSNKDRHLPFADPTVIHGNVSMGRFGHTITKLGDINADGYNDILVSAPYESSGTDVSGDSQFGAVYVFNGGKGGLRNYPSQVIRGSDLEKTPNFDPTKKIRGLGFSVKGEKDLDSNGYKDIVIGSYLSDMAVVIRSRPVVTLEAAMTIQPPKVDLETLSCEIPGSSTKSACFTVKTCFSYHGAGLPGDVAISYSYDMDSSKPDAEKRAYLLDNSPKNITLHANTPRCTQETVYMKKDIRDKLGDIAVTVSSWLRETHQPVEPILDKLTGTENTTQAQIFKDCGPDEICIPDLSMTAAFEPTAVHVGAYVDVVMSVDVSNAAENAYLATLVVEYPANASYVGVQESQNSPIRTCGDYPPFLLCEMGNPLKKNQHANVNIKFGINALTGDSKQLVFKSFVNSTNEQNNESNRVSTILAVDVFANVTIFNYSVPYEVILFKDAKNVSVSKPVTHKYDITNDGPSDIESASVSLLWPLKTPGGAFLLSLREVLVSGQMSCDPQNIIDASKALASDVMVPSDELKVESTNGGVMNYYNCHTDSHYCFEMKCIVGVLKTGEGVTVQLNGDLMMAPITASQYDSVVSSSLRFRVDKYAYSISPSDAGPTYTSEVSIYATYPTNATPQSVDWWIVAIAVAAGVLFLIIIIAVLWKCGFFKRKSIPEQEEDIQQRRNLMQKDEDPDDMQKELEEHIK